MRRSLSARLSLSTILTLIVGVLSFSTLVFAVAPDRIADPIVAQQLVKLAGGVPLQAQPQFDQGRVEPSLRLGYMTLLTVPSASQQKDIDQLLAEQQDPHSPLYHTWLTTEQYADRFGLSVNDIQKLTTWLQSQGFTIVRVARGRNFIVFSGTAAQAESTFQTEIHNFEGNGEKHFSNTTPPSIPAALSGVVIGIRGMSNFWPKPQARHSKPNYTAPGTSHTGYWIAPGDITTMYDLQKLYTAGITGTGQTLAVMGQTDVYLADLVDFRTVFDLSTAISGCTTNASDIITACNIANSFQYVLVNADPGAPLSGDLTEADIDIEWSGAVAQNAQIIYVNAPDQSGGGVWDSWYYAVDANVSPVITMSYGLCEYSEAFYGGSSGEFSFNGDEAELKAANVKGITFLNSTGDNGAAECDPQTTLATDGLAVSYPASSQYVTGVGGTMIPSSEYTGTYWSANNGPTGGSATQYIPEQGWNDAEEWGAYCTANPSAGFCVNNGISSWETAQTAIYITAGGGGASNCVNLNGSGVCTSGFGQPPWQQGLKDLGQSTPARFTPDVSLLASVFWPGFIVCIPESELGGGSTTSICASGISGFFSAGYTFGGTSISTPMFAGIVTLLNQYLGNTTTGLGNINPTLYALAAKPANGAFHLLASSTSTGSNGVYCEPGTPSGWPVGLICPAAVAPATEGFFGFSASKFDPTTNYNLVTGLGSVDAYNLAVAWAATGLPSTTTTVTSSQNPAGVGVSVTFTATVTTTGSNPPTGTVTFYDGATEIGSGTLSTVSGSQVATFATSTLAIGAHSITAVYAGDTKNAGSTSVVLTETITGDTTATNLGASKTNPAYGASITLTATVSTSGAHTPTGTVTFYDGSTNIGSGTLSGSGASATATYVTKSTDLAVGANQLTAAYGGDANNAASTSQPLTVTTGSPTFTLTNTGATSVTVLAGIAGSGYAFTIAPVAPAPNFGANVTLSCAIAPTDPTLTASACVFTVNGTQTSTIPATNGSTAVTLNVNTAGPNTPEVIKNLRRRADNRSPWLPLALPLAGIVMVGFAGRKMSKYFLIAALCALLVLLGLLIACGGSSSPPPVGINVSPTGSTVYPNDANDAWPSQTASFTATVTNSSANVGVNWALSSTVSCTGNPSPCGSFTSTATATGSTLAYTAPTVAAGLPGSVTATATSAADPSKTAKGVVTLSPATVPGTYIVTLQITDPAAQNQPPNLQFTIIVQ